MSDTEEKMRRRDLELIDIRGDEVNQRIEKMKLREAQEKIN